MRLTFPFKLVRDEIPAIIEAKGGECIVKQLKPDEYVVALRRKLVEESREILKAKTRDQLASELADLLEVAETIRIIHGIPLQDIEQIRKTKNLKVGGFNNGTMLLFAYSND